MLSPLQEAKQIAPRSVMTWLHGKISGKPRHIEFPVLADEHAMQCNYSVNGLLMQTSSFRKSLEEARCSVSPLKCARWGKSCAECCISIATVVAEATLQSLSDGEFYLLK